MSDERRTVAVSGDHEEEWRGAQEVGVGHPARMAKRPPIDMMLRKPLKASHQGGRFSGSWRERQAV
jgi:hypothetical protein